MIRLKIITNIILPTIKECPKIIVLVVVVNIRTKFNYTPSYRKALIAKQKALEKMHSGWNTLYNEV